VTGTTGNLSLWIALVVATGFVAGGASGALAKLRHWSERRSRYTVAGVTMTMFLAIDAVGRNWFHLEYPFGWFVARWGEVWANDIATMAWIFCSLLVASTTASWISSRGV